MSDRTKIRRGPARGTAKPRARSGSGRPRVVTPQKRKTGFAALVAKVPISGEMVRKAGNGALIALLAGGVVAGVVAMRLPQMAGVALGETIGSAGFVVRSIQIKGIDKMDRDVIYAAAANQQSRAMPLVDLEGTRAKLMQHGWIQDARVSRRLPDTLVIDILERKPAAIWQNQRRLALVDPTGTVIAPVDLDSMPDDLPVVIGPGANLKIGELDALLEAVPQLKPVLAGATWIGGRRWDLRFHSGEVLALPEGEAPAIAALKKFAALDQRSRLLGQGFVRFDMRVPDKMVVRVTHEPGQTIDDIKAERAAKAAAAAASGDNAEHDSAGATKST